MIGGQCDVYYVEEFSHRRERTRTFDLWDLCVDPSKIPKEVWLVVADPDADLP